MAFFLVGGGLAGYSACACGGGGVENICEGEFGGRGGWCGLRRRRDKCAASEWDIARQWHLFVSRERPIYQAPSCHFRLYYSCAKCAIYADLHHPPSSYHRGFIIHDEFQPGQNITTNSTSFKFCTPPGVDQTGCMEVGTSERIYSATKPTHTPIQSSTPTIRRNIPRKKPSSPLPRTLPTTPSNQVFPPPPPPLSLILSSQTPPAAFSHISSTTNYSHLFAKYPFKSSRVTVFGYLQIWIDGGFLGVVDGVVMC